MSSLVGDWKSLILAVMLIAAAFSRETPSRANTSAAPIGDLHQQYRFDGSVEPTHYRLFVPTNYNPEKSFPVVVVLHGSGTDENGPIDKSDLRTIAQQRGYIVIAPFGSRGGAYGNIYPVVVTKETAMGLRGAEQTMTSPELKGLPSAAKLPSALKEVAVPSDDFVDQSASELTPDFREGARAELETMNVLALIRSQYNVDPSRIYLMGNSMGGMGTAYLAIKYPMIWAAISPEGGPVATWSYPFARLREHHIAALCVHGEFDEHSSAHWSQVFADQAKADGVDASFLLVAGGHHADAWTKVLTETFDFFDAHVNSNH